jgi:hypothetical protein
MIRERKASAPRPSTLDPYLTDGSDASGSIAGDGSRSNHGSLTHRTPAAGMGTAVNTPSTGNTHPQLFSSDDEGGYWAESDSGSCAYDRHGDLVGSVDGGYSSEGSAAVGSTLGGARNCSSGDLKATGRSTSTGNAATEAATSSAVMGIALKDEGSRDSATSSHGGASARLPRRSQSFESVGSNGSNSNSRARPAKPATRTSTPPTAQPMDQVAPGDDWTVGSRDYSRAAGAGGCDEDSCLSMRLSQDEDESRSMLFSHLREDSRSCSVRSRTGSVGAGAATTTSTAGVGGLFGLVMRNVVNVANYITGSAQPAEVASNAAQDSCSAGHGRAEELDMRVSEDDDDDDASTLIEADLEEGAEEQSLQHEQTSNAGASAGEDQRANEGAAPASSEAGETALSKAKQQLLQWAQLRPDMEKVTVESRAKLAVFEKAVLKGHFPRAVQNILFRCLITREVSPTDGAVQVSCALCALQQVRDRLDGKKHSNKLKRHKQTADSKSPSAQEVLDGVSAVLSKLYQRNKKIVAADSLTVSTIAAACVLHATLLLHYYGQHHALCTPALQSSTVTAVEQCLDRLVLRLTSTLLEASEVPWLLQYQGVAPTVRDEDDLPHIERFVQLLSARFSGTTCWVAVRDAVMRYDYTFQRNLISPVKVKPSSSQRRKIAAVAAGANDISATVPPANNMEGLQLFDVLSGPSQQPAVTALPPKGRIKPAAVSQGSTGAVSGNISNPSMPPPAAPLVKGKGAVVRAAAATGNKSLIAELLQKTRKRKAGLEVEEAPVAVPTAAGPGPVAAAPAAAAAAAVRAAVAEGAPPQKRRNILLSEQFAQPVGHRTSMGVGKKVVISTKTLAANAVSSAAVLALANSTKSARSSSGSNGSSSSMRGADHFTNTPRKSITFSDVHGTPLSSQRDEFALYTHGTASAVRHRNTTIIESTPMEQLQPRRAPSSALYAPQHHLADSIAFMHSPGSPDSAGGRRRRAPSTGGSKSSSSSGDSARKAGGMQRNSLSMLFSTQDDEHGEAPNDGEEAHPTGDYALLSQARGQQARRSLMHTEGFHYLPSSSADGDREQR